MSLQNESTISKNIHPWTDIGASYIIVFVSGHEEIRHVDWQDVGEKLFIVSLEVFHLLLLLCKYLMNFLPDKFLLTNLLPAVSTGSQVCRLTLSGGRG